MTPLPTRSPAEAVALVEIHDGERWIPVCTLDDLLPGRGVALLVGGRQVAAFRDRAGALHALDNRDPFSGAYVLSRGLLGSRDGIPVLISPMYKQTFDLRTGICLDEDTAPDGTSSALRVWPVRLAADEPHAGSGEARGDTSRRLLVGVREP